MVNIHRGNYFGLLWLLSATQWKVVLKGEHFTLKENIAYPKRDFTSHLCTKEWETTHQLNKLDIPGIKVWRLVLTGGPCGGKTTAQVKMIYQESVD